MVTIQKPIDVFNRYIISNDQFISSLPEARIGYLDMQLSNQTIMTYFYDKYVNESYKLLNSQHEIIKNLEKNIIETHDKLQKEIRSKNDQITKLSDTLLKIKLKEIESYQKLALVTEKLFSRYGIKSISLKKIGDSEYDSDMMYVLSMIEESIKNDIDFYEDIDIREMRTQHSKIKDVIDTLRIPEENTELLINDLIRILNITSNGQLQLVNDKNQDRHQIDSHRPPLTDRDPTVYIIVNNIEDIAHNYDGVFLYHRQYLLNINDPQCNLIFKVPFAFPLEEINQIITNTSIWFFNKNQIYDVQNYDNQNIIDNLTYLFYSYNVNYDIISNIELKEHYTKSVNQYVLKDLRVLMENYYKFITETNTIMGNTLSRPNERKIKLLLSSDLQFNQPKYIKVLDEKNDQIKIDDDELKEILSSDSIFTNYVLPSTNKYLSNLSSNPIIYFIINIVRNHNIIRCIINFIIYLLDNDINKTHVFALNLMKYIKDGCDILNIIDSNLINEKFVLINDLNDNIRAFTKQYEINKSQNEKEINDLLETLSFLTIDECKIQLSGYYNFIDIIINVLVNRIENIEQMINLLNEELKNNNSIHELSIILNNKKSETPLKFIFFNFIKTHFRELNLTKIVLSNLRNEYNKYNTFRDMILNDANEIVARLISMNSDKSIYNNLIDKVNEYNDNMGNLKRGVRDLKREFDSQLNVLKQNNDQLQQKLISSDLKIDRQSKQINKTQNFIRNLMKFLKSEKIIDNSSISLQGIYNVIKRKINELKDNELNGILLQQQIEINDNLKEEVKQTKENLEKLNEEKKRIIQEKDLLLKNKDLARDKLKKYSDDLLTQVKLVIESLNNIIKDRDNIGNIIINDDDYRPIQKLKNTINQLLANLGTDYMGYAMETQNEITRLKNTLDDIRKSNKELQSKNDQLTTSNTQLTQTINELKAKIDNGVQNNGMNINNLGAPAPIIGENERQEIERLKQQLEHNGRELEKCQNELQRFTEDNIRNYPGLQDIIDKLVFQNNNHGDGKFDWRSIDRTAFFQRANVLNQELKTVLNDYGQLESKYNSICTQLKTILGLDPNMDCESILEKIKKKLKDIKPDDNQSEQLTKLFSLNIKKANILEQLRFNRIKFNLSLKEQDNTKLGLIKDKIDQLEKELTDNDINISDIQAEIQKSKPSLIDSVKEFFTKKVDTDTFDLNIISMFNDIISNDKHKQLMISLENANKQIPQELLNEIVSLIRNEISNQRRLIIKIHDDINLQHKIMNTQNKILIDDLSQIRIESVHDENSIKILDKISNEITDINRKFYQFSKKSIDLYKSLFSKLVQINHERFDEFRTTSQMIDSYEDKLGENILLSMYTLDAIISSDEFKKCIDYMIITSDCVNDMIKLISNSKNIISLHNYRSLENPDDVSDKDINDNLSKIMKLINKLSIISFEPSYLYSFMDKKSKIYQSEIEKIMMDIPEFQRLLQQYKEEISNYNKLNEELSKILYTDGNFNKVKQLKNNIRTTLERINEIETLMFTTQSQIIFDAKNEIIEGNSLEDLSFDTRSDNTTEKTLKSQIKSLNTRHRTLLKKLLDNNIEYNSETGSIKIKSDSDSRPRSIPETKAPSVHSDSHDSNTETTENAINVILLNYIIKVVESFENITSLLVEQLPDDDKRVYSTTINDIKESINYLKDHTNIISHTNLEILDHRISSIISLVNKVITSSIKMSIDQNINIIEAIKQNGIQDIERNIIEFNESVNILSNYIPLLTLTENEGVKIIKENIKKIQEIYPQIMYLLNNFITSKSDEFNDLSEEIKKLKKSNDQLRGLNNQLLQRITNYEQTIERLNSKKDELEQKILECNDKNVNSVKSSDYETLKQKFNDTMKHNEKLESDNKELKISLKQIEKEIKKVQEEKNNVIKSLTEKQREFDLQLSLVSPTPEIDMLKTDIIINFAIDLIFNIFLVTLTNVMNPITITNETLKDINIEANDVLINNYQGIPILYSIGFGELIMFNIIIKYLSNPFKISDYHITLTSYNNFFNNHIDYLINKLKIDNTGFVINPTTTKLHEVLYLSDNLEEFLKNINSRIENAKQTNDTQPNFNDLVTVPQQIFKKLIVDSSINNRKPQDIIIGGAKGDLKIKFDKMNENILFKNNDSSDLYLSILEISKHMSIDYQITHHLKKNISDNISSLDNEDLKNLLYKTLIDRESRGCSFGKLFTLFNLKILKSQLFTENLTENGITIIDNLTLNSYLYNIFLNVLRKLFESFNIKADFNSENFNDSLENKFKVKLSNILPLYLHIIKSNKLRLINMYKEIKQIS